MELNKILITGVAGFIGSNLGESNTISLMELISILERYTERKAILNFLPMQKGDLLNTYVDISKARLKLNYNPINNFENGIKDFINWFKDSNLGS